MTPLVRTAVAVGAAVAIGAGGVAVARQQPDTGCPAGVRTLDVVTAPELAPVVAEVAADLARARDGACRRTTVRAEAPHATAAGLASGAPDVWIPDSAAWLHRAPASRAAAAVSVARTPVLLAGPPQARLQLTDPARSATSAAVVLALAATQDRPALAETLRAARVEPVDDGGRAADPPAADTAVPVPEQVVRAGGSRVSTVPLGAVALDYPMVVLADGPLLADAQRLQDALTGAPGREARAKAGFAPPAVEPGLPRDALRRAARILSTLRAGSRMLTVLDVSGSMGQPVPGTGGTTRIELTRTAALRGLGLYPDDAHIGLWEFATDLADGADHRELVPLSPLGANRVALAEALGSVQFVPGGGTGLYDTALAAVRTVRSGWDPERVNAVVLLSDGRNQDEDSIGLVDLVETLRSEGRRRPVPVITIALGADSDPAALAAISLATGGSSYVVRDPREIRRVFLDAVGRRPCRPAC